MRDASASVLTGFPEEGKGIQSGAAMWKEMNMEATLALAPALGADAASLVGRALHQQCVQAATRVQAVWRGRAARRVYLRHAVRRWLCANYGREEPLPRALGDVLMVDTDTVHGVSAAGTPWSFGW